MQGSLTEDPQPQGRALWRPSKTLWLLGVLVLCALAFVGRRTFIRSFFADGGPGEAPMLSQADAPMPAVTTVQRLRVVLLDGLGLDHAMAMPELDRVCSTGLDLVVDNGFPTVSLPVQHVLWTGLTQTQSGVMYRIGMLPKAPPGALPARIPDSVAVAQSHAAIVHSFGFATAIPPVEDTAAEASDSRWQTHDFAFVAADTMASPARLAFVHVLGIDEAGHAHGGASPQYDAAVERADALLAALVAADPDPASTRWVVLSDHGHRPGGGHGGAERSIRLVRACIFGGPPLHAEAEDAALRSGTIHLVDLHRVLVESLGLLPGPDSRGRPLLHALTHYEAGATLPRPSAAQWLVAGLIAMTGLGVSIHAAAGRPSKLRASSVWALPWWLVLAYAGHLVAFGLPTLSNPTVYPPLGRDMLLAALPGLAVAVVTVAWWKEEPGWGRILRAQLALPCALTLAALVTCGALAFALGLTRTPPLVPLHTAHASWLLSATAAGSFAIAVTLLVRTAARKRAS